MTHDFDYIYKGHEVVVLHDSTGYMFDVRDDNFDGELIYGECEIETKRETVIFANAWIDQYIYDQTHFTEGISI